MTAQISEQDAFDIYQNLLDRICEAYFADDFPGFREAIHVPHDYHTETEHLRIEDYEQMEQAFACFRDYLLGIGVTDYNRQCIGATAIGATKIMGGHTTDLLRHGERLREPYDVWATLELIDGIWKVTASQNGVPTSSWQAQAFRAGADMKLTAGPTPRGK